MQAKPPSVVATQWWKIPQASVPHGGTPAPPAGQSSPDVHTEGGGVMVGPRVGVLVGVLVGPRVGVLVGVVVGVRVGVVVGVVVPTQGLTQRLAPNPQDGPLETQRLPAPHSASLLQPLWPKSRLPHTVPETPAKQLQPELLLHSMSPVSEQPLSPGEHVPCTDTGVLVGVLVAVLVGVVVGVVVGVLVGVFVGVLVGVFVGVLVGVFVGVLVGVFVGVLVGGIGVLVCVLVGVSVAVAAGVGWWHPPLTHTWPAPQQ
jgi:hypothetical protein